MKWKRLSFKIQCLIVFINIFHILIKNMVHMENWRKFFLCGKWKMENVEKCGKLWKMWKIVENVENCGK